MTSGGDIQGLLDAAPKRVSGVRLVGRATVTIPPGDYTLAAPIVIDRCVDLDMRGASLFPAPGVDAIRVVPGGEFSRIAAPFVVGDTQPHAGIGIDVQAHHVEIESPFVREMGTGIRVYGTAGNGTNANACHVKSAVLFRCWGTALHLKGGDCNAGNFEAVEIVGGKVGVMDESFLGNLVHGMHVSTTSEHAIQITRPANYGTWSGVYVENDCASALPPGTPKIASQPGVTWLGGNAVAHARLGDRVGMGKSAVRFEETAPSGHTLAVTIPHASADSYISLTHLAPQGAVSGGTEMLLRRKATGGLVEWAMRKAGATVAAWSATRGDHPDGFGLFRPGKDHP